VVKINVTRGRSAYGVCRYVLQEDKILVGNNKTPADVICGNMVGTTAAELSMEFKISQRKKPRIKVNAVHYSVSFPPGEDVNLAEMELMSRHLLREMGHSPTTQFLAVKHYDKVAKIGVAHFHIVASPIGLDGTVRKSSWDRLQAKKVERYLEKEFHLSEHPPQHNLRRHLTTGEYRKREKLRVPARKERLWEIIDQAAIGSPNYAEFFTRLHENGVTLKVKQDEKNREILGVSYGFEGLAFSGYRLGSQYTYQGIQKYLGVKMAVDFLETEVSVIQPIDEPVAKLKAKKMVDMER
jgi:Relaxase/Mobilisation nuclease domain